MSASEKKVIVVTGASRGIGRAIALGLASPQHFIYVNYLSNQSKADEVVAEIKKRDGDAKAIGFDVSNPEQVEKAFAQIAEENGGIDVLVNNAGVPYDGLLMRYKDEDWQKSINVNLTSVYACTKYALKTMMKRKNNGRIISMTSVVGQMGNAGQSVYAATKAGIIGFTKSMAREVASRNITVNAVAPGFVKTEMTDALTPEQQAKIMEQIPLKRVAEPEEIASVVRFLVSSEAAYITGQTISVNGGMYL
ncbi:MAG: 3-oxoacyl-[acyl-carrier-protein] reductase [Proteobacteria bacterium]|jgi:3-oxoacyl-[acyl-carrier protein] reductase|nr:3-oxoacyl-[acyl-carrier-protein] reductase [Pseudomonadota bacterium]